MRSSRHVLPCDWRSSVVMVLLVSSACGSAEERAATPVEEPSPSLESSPWLVTFARPPSGVGPVLAQRFHHHELESVLLEASATWRPSWSPSGRWLSYQTRSSTGDTALWMRRLEGDVWHEARLVTSQRRSVSLIGTTIWSPAGDQLLFDEVRGSVPVGFGIATPQPDGSLDVRNLDRRVGTDERVSAEWSPTGDRVVLASTYGPLRRITLHDVGRDASGASPWLSRELTSPAGTTFDSVLALGAERWVSVSSDGRWLVARVKGPGEGLEVPKALVAFPTNGEGDMREIDRCPASVLGPSSESCVVWSWHPEGATLLFVRRRRSEGALTLEAWSPDSGRNVVVADREPVQWLAPRSTRFLTQRTSSMPPSIVDVRDVAHPVIADVPTAELRSYRGATASPDGRWLVLSHAVGGETSWIEAVDLRGEPPWPHREIFRRTGKELPALRIVWSPSSAFVMVDERTGVRNAKRGVRIAIETGATSAIEYTQGPVPSSHYWKWDNRMAPDDETIAIGREGAVALWPIGVPLSGAAKLAGVPEWAELAWRPTNAP